MPFALQEPQPLRLLENILKTVIRKDVPNIARLLTDELDKIENLVRFIGLSGVDGMNYSSLAQNAHITKYKAEQYVSLLERAFVLHRVLPVGSNVMKEPKIVMALPYRLLYKSFDEAIGGLREDFFVGAIKALNKEIFYLKSTRGAKTPDYLVRGFEDIVFEEGFRRGSPELYYPRCTYYVPYEVPNIEDTLNESGFRFYEHANFHTSIPVTGSGGISSPS